MNKRNVLVLSLFAPLFTLAETDLTIEYSKCSLKYDTMNGHAEIILYNTEPSLGARMTKEVFQNVFKLTEFEIKELIFSEPEEKPSTISAIAQAKNFMRNTPVEQLFSNMLNTKAEVHSAGGGPAGMKMTVTFPMQENMHIVDDMTNGMLKGIYWSKDSTIITLEFDLSDFPGKPLEVVVEWKCNAANPAPNPERIDRRRRTAHRLNQFR